MSRDLTDMEFILKYGTAILLLVTILFGIWIVRYLIMEINRLRKRLDRLDRSETRPQISTESHSSDLSRMLGRIPELERDMKRFREWKYIIDQRLSSYESHLEGLIRKAQNMPSPREPFDPIKDIPIDPAHKNQGFSTRFTSSRPGQPVPPEYSHHPPYGGFVPNYNRALGSGTARRDFEKTYNPERLGVINGEERLGDLERPPIFGMENSGDYWLVSEDGETFIVPRIDLVLKDANRNSGGIDYVFQCGEYDSGDRYRIAQLEEPARLKKQSTDQWTVSQKGRILLERYD